jgi:S1-C subfamily serine protease
MLTRLALLVATGIVSVLPLSAQERVRERERVSAPRARVWINGDEVNPMQWLTNRRARLGITLDMRAVENDSLGATISSVTPGGPAAKAGLRSGDIITKLDGKSLVRAERERARREDNDDDDDGQEESLAGLRLVELVSKLEPGDTVAVEYVRGKETKTASVVTSAERSLAMRDFGDGETFFRMPEFRGMMPKTPMPRGVVAPGERGDFFFRFGGPFSELELAPLNADLGAYFGATEGVLVIDAPEKNTLGLRGGDVILSVDGRKARGPSSLLRILQTYETGDVMKLEIMRNKSRQTISSKVERDEDE